MKNKWLVIALVVSLSLNLVIAGFVIGRLGSGAGFPARIDPIAGFPRLMSQLPDERQEELRPLMGSYFQTMRPTFRAMRAAQEEVFSAVKADPYQSEATRIALATFREKLLESQTSAHDAFIEFTSALTTEERHLLAKKMHQPWRSRHNRKPPHPPQ